MSSPGGFTGETPWVFGEVYKFRVGRGEGKKPTFQYRLPVVGDVCRPAWILCAGYCNKNNGRVRTVEALIRRGVKAVPERRAKILTLNVTAYTRAFIHDYIFHHSQCSPSCKILYVDHIGAASLYERYRKEMRDRRMLLFSSFQKLWQEVMNLGVTDPETAVHYAVQIRNNHAKGFVKCDICSYWRCKIQGTAIFRF